MLVLGLDTATAQAGVAIGGPDGVRASFHLVGAGRHAETVAPAIEFVCRQAGTKLESVTAVAVDIGPGLFTGLRVGVATARSIAFALHIPTVAVSSLEILAFSVRMTSRKIVSIIDALSGEVYYACYLSEGGGTRPLTEPRLASPGEVAGFMDGLEGEVLAVGDGARRYAGLFASRSHVDVADAGFQFPSAASLVDIATARALRGELAPDSSVQIMYLKKPYVHSK